MGKKQILGDNTLWQINQQPKVKRSTRRSAVIENEVIIPCHCPDEFLKYLSESVKGESIYYCLSCDQFRKFKHETFEV
jgi:hypothetical protein